MEIELGLAFDEPITSKCEWEQLMWKYLKGVRDCGGAQLECANNCGVGLIQALVIAEQHLDGGGFGG